LPRLLKRQIFGCFRNHQPVATPNSANARPIRWKYSDTKRRIRSSEFTATGS
jgi:hypothetical protein